MAKDKFYITTSILYSNAKPHIGFALELLQADAIARWQRLQGKEVYFLTGTDEHGVKVYDKATEQGKTPQAWVDEVAESVQVLLAKLNISNDDFIRTTDQKRHWPTAQTVWEKLVANGDIELGHYSGYYCVNDEAYITKTEAESPEYANKKIIQLEEDNYLFKIGRYQDQLVTFLEQPGSVVPAHRAKEMLNFIKTGLNDISFSRPKEKLSWGIPVPNDDSQVMYVWPDALTNYISAIGYVDDQTKFKKYWPADVHVIGKDILRFHALFWPAMLTGIGEALPKQILVHGHILSDGQKMSKSLGNVVDPIGLIDKWGVDAVRYYLLREIPTLGDGDYSETRFVEVYNSALANDLGNLLSRVLKLANGTVPPRGQSFDDYGNPLFWSELNYDMEQLNLASVLESIQHRLIDAANKFIAQEKPWALAATELERSQSSVYYVLEVLRHISIALYPFLPTTSDRIREQLGLKPIDPDNFDFAKETQWGGLPVGHQLGRSEILFPKQEGK
ncbi:MAG: methionine--tRNA ligase [Patescibacteria group bacterium]|jgi:methionyl-tRNA synthetase